MDEVVLPAFAAKSLLMLSTHAEWTTEGAREADIEAIRQAMKPLPPRRSLRAEGICSSLPISLRFAAKVPPSEDWDASVGANTLKARAERTGARSVGPDECLSAAVARAVADDRRITVARE